MLDGHSPVTRSRKHRITRSLETTTEDAENSEFGIRNSEFLVGLSSLLGRAPGRFAWREQQIAGEERQDARLEAIGNPVRVIAVVFFVDMRHTKSFQRPIQFLVRCQE